MKTIRTNVKKRQQRKRKAIYLKALLFLSFCLITYTLITINREPVSTETVRYGTMEDKINTSGYILKKETVVNSPSNGIISCAVREGERVSKNAKVATVFEGKIDESLQLKIDGINEQIQRISYKESKKGLIIGDIFQIENAIAKRVEGVVDAAYRKDTDRITAYKYDLGNILSQRAKEIGVEVPKTDKKEQLIAEKDRLESLAGYKRFDLYSPAAGAFCTKIDGLEGFFNLSDFSELTPGFLARADEITYKKNKGAKAGEGIIKIVDNYEWYYAAIIDARWIQDLQKGDYVLLRFPELSDKALDANIEYISEETDAKAVMVISCMQYVENIYSLRRLDADIIRKRYSGFKVPISAVRVRENSENGVYIIKENVPIFKNIEVLYKGEEYVIVKENNSMKNALLLYDEVILSGGAVTEGKVLR